MDCQKARDALEEILNNDRAFADYIELEQHLSGCSECQAWYDLHLPGIYALEQLERVPSPPDFAQRVLDRLPDKVPSPQPAPTAQTESVWQRLQSAWDSLWSSLTRPTTRRVLAPALTVAATVLLALGIWLGLKGLDLSTTPGAATGPATWLIGLGVILVAATILVLLVTWRRKE